MSALAFLPTEPPDERNAGARYSPHFDPQADEAHWYVVELWNDDGTHPERLLATARTGAIGYAAYFAAAKDLPHRIITLRRDGVTLSRWSVRRD